MQQTQTKCFDHDDFNRSKDGSGLGGMILSGSLMAILFCAIYYFSGLAV